ncbi:MAG TPA: STAS domain-containing protein [Planctomycetota bacterium]|nr:STAS domain-containing protein [Planctomycetota bacterium]
MKIEQSQQGTVAVLVPVGALIDDDRVQFAELLKKHIEKGNVKMVVDMNSVPFVESEGLEMLLDISEAAAEAGGGLRILNPSDIVKDILLCTRLVSKLEVYHELSDARRSLL